MASSENVLIYLIREGGEADEANRPMSVLEKKGFILNINGTSAICLTTLTTLTQKQKKPQEHL